VERLEGRRLAGQRGFFLALFRAMVCDGEKEARRRAAGVLVVEPDGFAAAADVFAAPKGFGLHLRLSVHVDSVYPKPDDPPPEQGGAVGLHGLRAKKSAALEFLSELRREDFLKNYFFGAASGPLIPYF